MHLLLISIVLCLWLFPSCRSSQPPPEEVGDHTPLPDLTIKKVTYRPDLSTPRLLPQRVDALVVTYEFRVEIENIGTAPLTEPFYISYTTTTYDYQNFIYSRHELLNAARTVIARGKSFTFVVTTEIEIPRRVVPSNFPIRFYINTEGQLNTLGYQAPRINERKYNNNIYELSVTFGRRNR